MAVSIRPLEGDKPAVTAPVVAEYIKSVLTMLLFFWPFTLLFPHVSKTEEITEVTLKKIYDCLSIILLLGNLI